MLRLRFSWNCARSKSAHLNLFLPEIDYATFGSLLSPICLSSVCNVGAPYSEGWTCRQYFFTAV